MRISETIDFHRMPQQDVRDRFVKIVKHLDMTKMEICKEIGISHPTLFNFITKGKEIDLKRLNRMIKFIEKIESEFLA